MSSHHSEQMSQWSQVSRIALCMAKVKVSELVSYLVSEWQGHLLSCSGQLKMETPYLPELSKTRCYKKSLLQVYKQYVEILVTMAVPLLLLLLLNLRIIYAIRFQTLRCFHFLSPMSCLSQNQLWKLAPKTAQKWPKITQKKPKNGTKLPKWPKNDPKWPKN